MARGLVQTPVRVRRGWICPWSCPACRAAGRSRQQASRPLRLACRAGDDWLSGAQIDWLSGAQIDWLSPHAAGRDCRGHGGPCSRMHAWGTPAAAAAAVTPREWLLYRSVWRRRHQGYHLLHHYPRHSSITGAGCCRCGFVCCGSGEGGARQWGAGRRWSRRACQSKLRKKGCRRRAA
eukprot:COSAG01_NODE_2126_length_8367_cov_3.977866_15_plen_178_part_00